MFEHIGQNRLGPNARGFNHEDEIAISLGADPQYAAQLAQSFKEAVDTPSASSAGSTLPPPPLPKTATAGDEAAGKAAGSDGAHEEKKPDDPPKKKARGPKPPATGTAYVLGLMIVEIPLIEQHNFFGLLIVEIPLVKSFYVMACQGADMEVTILVDDAKSFVQEWVSAATSAEGLAVKLCGQPLVRSWCYPWPYVRICYIPTLLAMSIYIG